MRKLIPFLLLMVYPLFSFGSQLIRDEYCGDLMDFMEEISEVTGEDILLFFDDDLISKKTYMGYRDYNKLVTPAEKKIIHYLLKTISQKSLVYLLANRSTIEKVGASIDNLHPLRFLESIFSDEELKTYLRGIKSRGSWVWKDFIKELKESLEDEAMIGNMTDAILVNFSCVLNVDIDLFYDLVRNYKWEQFIKVLLAKIPRSGDNGRYDQ